MGNPKNLDKISLVLDSSYVQVHTMDETDPVMVRPEEGASGESFLKKFSKRYNPESNLLSDDEAKLMARQIEVCDDVEEFYTLDDQGNRHEVKNIWDRLNNTTSTSRRMVLGGMLGVGAAAGFQMLSAPSAQARMSFQSSITSDGTVLVAIFLRGGFEADTAFVPMNDPNYFKLRPTMAVKNPINIDGVVGLNPSLSALKPIVDRGECSVVVEVGSDNPIRSHPEKQDDTERGRTPVTVQSSMFGRYCMTKDPLNTQVTRAIAFGDNATLSLLGTPGGGARVGYRLADVNYMLPDPGHLAAVENYIQSTIKGNSIVAENTRNVLDTVRNLADIRSSVSTNISTLKYENNNFAAQLNEIETMILSNSGLEIATLDAGSWDMHSGAGLPTDINGWMNKQLTALGNALATFWQRLGEARKNVVVVTFSEFGRKASENGSQGFDHGFGGGMLVLSTGLKKPVFRTDGYSLAASSLDNGDRNVNIDYRQVLSELMVNKLNNNHISEIFPGFSYVPNKLHMFA